MKPSISVIVLTYNEENNVEACLQSVFDWTDHLFILDSYSTDRTLEIVKKYTNNIYSHPFENQARQLNWALCNLPFKTEWILRLDADEKVTPELKNEILEKLPNLSGEVTGLYMKRRVYFMGRWIRHGGYYPTWLLRIWRRGKAHCEERWMDEHIKIREGKVLFLENDIIDDNHNKLHWWIGKHNSYATREAIDLLNLKHKFVIYDTVPTKLFGTQEQRKRWLKQTIYANMPLFLRPFLYFIYRYVIRLGFLDGKEGLIWHFLQGLWYRFLVDAKIYEVQMRARAEDRNVGEIICEMLESGVESGRLESGKVSTALQESKTRI
ncbi:MAG TPA: glycosyltransferase family 2 protein [Thermodesulfobacteriota bacterium]|nr:glycosyltransferase family 2 protein [Thermodesulfobacteriota bacterium]